jgi:hypothetical protein
VTQQFQEIFGGLSSFSYAKRDLPLLRFPGERAARPSRSVSECLSRSTRVSVSRLAPARSAPYPVSFSCCSALAQSRVRPSMSVSCSILGGENCDCRIQRRCSNCTVFRPPTLPNGAARTTAESS